MASMRIMGKQLKLPLVDEQLELTPGEAINIVIGTLLE